MLQDRRRDWVGRGDEVAQTGPFWLSPRFRRPVDGLGSGVTAAGGRRSKIIDGASVSARARQLFGRRREQAPCKTAGASDRGHHASAVLLTNFWAVALGAAAETGQGAGALQTNVPQLLISSRYVAGIISVVETCRRLKVPVRNYLGSVLPGLADHPINRIAELTPATWASRN